MVKVLPNTFALFEGHNIINPTAEPLCIHCSDHLVFAACEGCVVEVYDLPRVELVAKLRTIWPVCALVYNTHGDCILTLERRGVDKPGAAARIYSKWRGIMDEDKPQRVMMSLPGVLTGFSGPEPQPRSQPDAEIMELPVENASCIASCSLAPVVAVGSERAIRLFVLERKKEVSGETDEPAGLKVSLLMDIRTDMKLKKIAICGNFVACISTHRVRVVKCMFIGAFQHPWATLYPTSQLQNSHRRSNHHNQSCSLDHNYVTWSPSLVWEEETRGMAAVVPAEEGTSDQEWRNKQEEEEEDKMEEEEEKMEEEGMDEEVTDRERQPTPTVSFAFPRPSSQQTISTLTLPSISHAIIEAKREVGRHALEVLGPVEYVWGQPLAVELHSNVGRAVKCRVLTMLCRRFQSSGYAYVAEGKGRSATVAGDLLSVRTGAVGTGMASSDVKIGKAGGKGGLHSIELVPTVVEGESERWKGKKEVRGRESEGEGRAISDVG